MTSRVFLHVGLPKSGTTFLQAVLSNNRRTLREAGLLFPGKHGWKSQVRAVRDIREMPHLGRIHRREVPGSWDELAGRINAWSGDSVVSMEWLSRVEPHQLRRILDSLPEREVHVVFTIRDLGRTLPASWQESVLNRQVWTWQEFLAQQSDEELSGEDRKFWRLHDILALSDRWLIEIPPERVHVVTVPQSGAPPEALWDRFASVLGIAGLTVDTEDVRRNEGLDIDATEVVRRVNARSRAAKISPAGHAKVITQQLGKKGLALRGRAQRPVIPEELHPWVEGRAQALIDGLTARGVDVVGDLEELRPDLSRHRREAPVPTPEELLDVALDAIVLMTQQRLAADAGSEKAAAAAQREMARLRRQNERMRRRHAREVRRWQARPFRSALRVRVRRSRVLSGVARRLRGR